MSDDRESGDVGVQHLNKGNKAETQHLQTGNQGTGTRLPTQTYAPKDFFREVKYIHETCQHIACPPSLTHGWMDNDGNIFVIDYRTLTITVN